MKRFGQFTGVLNRFSVQGGALLFAILSCMPGPALAAEQASVAIGPGSRFRVTRPITIPGMRGGGILGGLICLTPKKTSPWDRLPGQGDDCTLVAVGLKNGGNTQLMKNKVFEVESVETEGIDSFTPLTTFKLKKNNLLESIQCSTGGGRFNDADEVRHYLSGYFAVSAVSSRHASRNHPARHSHHPAAPRRAASLPDGFGVDSGFGTTSAGMPAM